MFLNYRDTRPIYVQITDRYKERIGAGILLPGERLPSVRELAAELSINPNTIQRAYHQLENEGWIVTVPGKGCFVREGRSALEQEKQRLLRQLDDTAAALMALGLTAQELRQRLWKEEQDHA